jgi:uncharacterized protein (TIGR00159 family)
MQFFAILSNLRFQDILDILFLTIVAYYLYLWFRGTKALKALIGLLVLGGVYTAARTWGLFLTTWVFQILWQVLVLLLIILFQSEIRQVLERVNPLGTIGLHRLSQPGSWVSGFARAVFSLAARRIGALVIIERVDRVDEWITGCQALEGDPTSELLTSIFQKESPLHDGAVLIRGGRISRVACYLPLSPDEGLPKDWGTRHRAALGLSQRCDAWVLVVSEERGYVSLAREGEIVRVEDEDELSGFVVQAGIPAKPLTKTRLEKIRFLIINQWRIKLAAFALVAFLWLVLAGQQDFEVNFAIPVELKNLPEQLEIVEPTAPKVRVTIRGLRRDASTLDKESLSAWINLADATAGRMFLPIARSQVMLSDERLQIVRIEPQLMEFMFKEKLQPNLTEIRQQ